MSFDLNLNTVCNHRIYREVTELDTDLRSLRLSQPLAASNVEVFASNNPIPESYYKIIYDPQTLNIQQPRLIFLNKKWRALEDYFEVNYVTLTGFCPKCIGLSQLDDISYDVRGSLYCVRNEKLLLQNMEKFTVTEVKSNPFHLFVGTSLVSMLGQKIRDMSYISAKITQEINTTLNILKDLQSQYQYTGRPVTSGEILDQVLSVKVNFDKQDPTILRVDVDARAQSGQSVYYSQYLKA
jgi:hypothetical protein